jgi:type IV secretory pathway VirB10-like protein
MFSNRPKTKTTKNTETSATINKKEAQDKATDNNPSSANASSYRLPKDKSFSKRFIFLVIIPFAIVAAICLYFFVANSNPVMSDGLESDKNINSDLANQEVIALQAQNVRALPFDNSNVRLNNRELMIKQQSDGFYFNGKKLKDGDIVSINGKRYQFKDGQLIPLDDITPYKEGQFVMKDGKLYRVGKDGKLHLYDGKLKEGDILWKDGKPYIIGKDGKPHPLSDGQIVSIDGKPYMWKDGRLVPIDSQKSPYKAGQFVMKDGKLYRVGKDGKLHPYDGKLKEGDVVWKDGKAYIVGKDGKLHPLSEGQIVSVGGKPYMWKDGKLVPLSALGAKEGDLVEIDGKLYKIGKDGKLHPFDGKPKMGDTLWKDGKIHFVDAEGNAHAFTEGALAWGKDGQLYRVENGALKPYHKSCVPVLIDGKYYITNAQGKLQPFNEGDECIDNQGNKVVLAGNQIINIPSPQKKEDELNKLWQETLKKSDEKALSAPLTSYHPDDQVQSQETTQDKSSAGESGVKGLSAPDSPTTNAYASQNGQSSKMAFMKSAQVSGKERLDNTENVNTHPYSITAGSIIPATLVTGINSDLPGMIIARVSQNVYDSRTGKYLLIPQGTKITGVYDSQVTYGQSRVLMAWNRLEFPNGNNYDLEGMAGADLSGFAGLSGDVDNHYFRIFSSALLFSVFGAASQLTQPKDSGENGTSNSAIIYGAIGQQMTQVSSKMIEKNMDIQPTITIQSGRHFNILVSRTMVFDQPYQFDQI